MKNLIKKLKTKKFIFSIIIFLIIGFSVWNIFKSPYVDQDINDIVYAEPTEEAKNFDVKKYIESLPPLEYEKIDYPVKETYTYKFNRDYVIN